MFDFDGVIVDSETSTFLLLQNICLRHGVQLPNSLLPSRVGKKITKFVDETLAESADSSVREKIIEDFYETFLREPERYTEPIDATVDFVRNFDKQDIKYAVASVGGRGSIVSILQSLKIEDRFDLLVSSDDVKELKPNPEVYLKCLELLHLEPKDCVIIEDSLVGAEAGVASGIPVYIIRNGLNNSISFQGIKIAGFIEKSEDIAALAKGSR